MKINLLFFGQAADITGKASWNFSGITNTLELNEKLIENFPGLQTIKYSIAVNRKIVRENTILNNEDTVAILPPFSGG
ncbi:MAG: MoaD/ThiS family protein [Sphingobacteriales bacterium]|nr:MoaD/ThiS family protein [Sphingobacteriales bacterium]